MEAEAAIHGDRVFHHRFDCIEAHTFVADRAGFGDQAVGHGAAEPLAAKLRTDVEPLHLADFGMQFMQSAAAGELDFIFHQQQTASGRRIVSGEGGEFGVEILKAEAEAQRFCVFEEEHAGLRDLGRRGGLEDGYGRHLRIM